MLDKDIAEVNTIGTAGEVEKLHVSDINVCNEVDDHGDFKIEFPYEITISDSKDKTLLKEKTQGTLKAKDWNKKFYVKESANGNEYVAYSRYMSLLALVTIKKQKVGELPPKINLNDLVGFEFDAVVIRLKDSDAFIDWVGTFEANGVVTPALEDLKGVSVEPKSSATIEEKRETFNGKKGGAW